MSPNELHNSNMTDERITPYPLRMSQELRDLLESEAKDHKRSLHSEIINRLEKSFTEGHTLVKIFESSNKENVQYIDKKLLLDDLNKTVIQLSEFIKLLEGDKFNKMKY